MGVWDYISATEPERLRLVVPEWGPEDSPAVVYALPASIEDEARVRQVVKRADDPETWARLVYNKLVDENGDRIFSGVGFAEFKRKVPAVLSLRLGQQIYLGHHVSVEEAEGN